MIRGSRWISAVAATTGALLLGGITVSVAQTGTSANETYRACAHKSTGVMRLLTSASELCKDGEKLVMWSSRGEPGPAGAMGATGPAGAAGATGAMGPQGPAGADGRDGIDGTDGLQSVDELHGSACRVGTENESTLSVSYDDAGRMSAVCGTTTTTPPPPPNAFDVFYARMDAVPGATSRGDAVAYLERATNMLCTSATWTASNANGVHLHNGAAGNNGPVEFVFPRFSTNDGFTDECVSLNGVQLDELYAGRLYVDVHTPAFPGGEIRGQLLGAHHSFSGGMASSNVTSDPRPISSGGGIARATLTGLDLCFEAVWSNVSYVTAVHAHNGPAGQFGPVEFSLTPVGTFSNQARTCQSITPDVYGPLARGEIYVDVHTQQYQAGEIRGQLTPSA